MKKADTTPILSKNPQVRSCFTPGVQLRSKACKQNLSYIFLNCYTPLIKGGEKMKKFMVLFLSPMSVEEMMGSSTPEQMAEAMKPWVDWFERCGESIVDKGGPLGKGVIVGGGSETQARGYSILQAETVDQVKELLDNHPHLSMSGNGIEVMEMLPMGM